MENNSAQNNVSQETNEATNETTQTNATETQTNEGGGHTLTDLLNDEYKSNPSLKDFKSVDDLAKSYTELKSYQGRSLGIPSEDAGEEDWNTFYNKLLNKVPGVMPKPDLNNEEQSEQFWRSLGVPEELDGYKIELDDNVKPFINDDDVEFFKQVAYEAKIPEKQFQKALSKILEKDVGVIQQAEQAKAQGLQALQNTWGQAYEERMEKVEAIREQLFSFIPPNQMNAETAKSLYEVASRIGGEQIEMSGQGQSSGKPTPQEAKERIGEIMRNREHPYWNAEDPGHKAAIDKVIELHKAAKAG